MVLARIWENPEWKPRRRASLYLSGTVNGNGCNRKSIRQTSQEAYKYQGLHVWTAVHVFLQYLYGFVSEACLQTRPREPHYY